jgi:hypothetical protein
MSVRSGKDSDSSGASYWIAALLLIVAGVVLARIIRTTLWSVYRPEILYFDPNLA